LLHTTHNRAAGQKPGCRWE